MAAGTGYAKDRGIKRVSSGLIVYIVELVSIHLQDVIPSLPFQVRFSLSSEPNYANVDFNYIQFYNALVAHLNNPGLKEQNCQIHDFWNKYVFLLHTRLLLTTLEATLLQCSTSSEAKGEEEHATKSSDHFHSTASSCTYILSFFAISGTLSSSGGGGGTMSSLLVSTSSFLICHF